MLRRRREGKTDYRARKIVLLGRRPFIAVMVSSRYISVQFMSPTLRGDVSLASAHSKDLVKMGWKGSGKSIPGAYLTGLLAGLKASKVGVKNAILYAGSKPYIRGSRLAAVVKGIRDAGVDVPAEEETLPTDDKIRGEHIAEYAKILLAEDGEIYKARFSTLLKRGLQPEKYPLHFEEVREKILETYGVNADERVREGQ